MWQLELEMTDLLVTLSNNACSKSRRSWLHRSILNYFSHSCLHLSFPCCRYSSSPIHAGNSANTHCCNWCFFTSKKSFSFQEPVLIVQWLVSLEPKSWILFPNVTPALSRNQNICLQDCRETTLKVLLCQFQQNQNEHDKKECRHNLKTVTHKVSDHHLHHETRQESSLFWALKSNASRLCTCLLCKHTWHQVHGRHPGSSLPHNKGGPLFDQQPLELPLEVVCSHFTMSS